MSMAIVQMLSAVFGDVGRFACIILLILQLTSCGGTFPIETSPKFYNAIHNIMPMTYTVDGLRIIIGNGNMAILGNSIIVLLGIIIVCSCITLIYFKNSKKFS
jgi:putative membrane protein